MRAAPHILAIGLAGPAAAFSCGFDIECHETAPCGESRFTAEVALDAQSISTDAGALTIVAVKRSDSLITLFATGAGAEYLMSIGPETARLSAQINRGPVTVTYFGLCEGAF